MSVKYNAFSNQLGVGLISQTNNVDITSSNITLANSAPKIFGYASAATPSIITSGLIMHLDAGNTSSYSGSGTTWSDLVGSNDATLVNGPTFQSGNGGYIQFDGTNDRAEIGITYPANYTIHIALLASERGNHSKEAILDQGAGSRTNPVRLWKRSATYSSNGPGNFKIQNTNTFTAAGAISTTTIQDNTWYVVTATYDGTDLKMYVNGSLEDTESASAHGNNVGASLADHPASFGSSMQVNQMGVGELAMYNTALTATEVTANFDAVKSRYGL